MKQNPVYNDIARALLRGPDGRYLPVVESEHTDKIFEIDHADGDPTVEHPLWIGSGIEDSFDQAVKYYENGRKERPGRVWRIVERVMVKRTTESVILC